ncbi:hypothetical protein BU17DRAFT_83779 [Hysterangium stoloniferum]|nr:hypothetical protein BU17DRAFT_83779 [Hysterangium stoloniferum]
MSLQRTTQLLPNGGGEPQRQQQPKESWHPFAPIVLGMWIAYVAAYIVFLEKAVQSAPHDIDQRGLEDYRAGLLHTFFSQLHPAITTLYLVRVGASRFHGDRAAKSTWGELFWMTDKSWYQPLTFAPVLKTIIVNWVPVSITFIMFASTSMAAFITPSILSLAYPLGSVNTTLSFPVTPHGIFSAQAILDVDRETEIGTGMGSWATGLSIFDAYEFSIYTVDEFSDDLNDFVFSDDLGGADGNTTGLHLQGGCAPFPDDSTAVDQGPALFPIFCNSLPPNRDQKMNINVSIGPSNVTYSFCTYPPALTVPSGPDSNATAYC